MTPTIRATLTCLTAMAALAPWPAHADAGTTLTAHPVLVGVTLHGTDIGETFGAIQIDGDFAATLMSGSAEIAGRTLRFSIDGSEICAAVTDFDGVARCDLTAGAASLPQLMESGYDVSFVGDAQFRASDAHGEFIVTP